MVLKFNNLDDATNYVINIAINLSRKEIIIIIINFNANFIAITI